MSIFEAPLHRVKSDGVHAVQKVWNKRGRVYRNHRNMLSKYRRSIAITERVKSNVSRKVKYKHR